MKTFSWQAPEYLHTQKTSDWYWTVGIISAALVLTSLIFGNYLFSIILAIGAFTLTMFTMRKPSILTIEINDKGIRINTVLYPYHALDAFGIDEGHTHGARLFLKSKKMVMPLVTLPLAKEDPEEIRTFLEIHIKEETFDQGLLHSLLERAGF